VLSVAAHADGALVGVDDGLGDGKPQAAARNHSLGGGLGAVEPLEDPLPVGGLDADAGVGDAEDRLVALHAQGHLNRPAVRGELHRVGDQVAEKLGDARWVHGEAGASGRGQDQVNVLTFRLRPGLLYRLDSEVGQVRVVELQRQLARLHLGQEQQIPHQAEQSFRVPLDDLGEVVGVQLARPLVPQQLDIADDRGQRGPQLVRDQGHELVLQPVQLPQLLILDAQLPGLKGQLALDPDLRRNVPADPERADDPAMLVAERHLRRGYPGVRPAAKGLAFHQSHERLAGAHDVLLVRERRRGVCLGEYVEIGLPDQILRGPAGGDRVDPAVADEQEPARQVLEVDALPGGGQQVAHADELEVEQRLTARRPSRLRRDPGYDDPPSGWRVSERAAVARPVRPRCSVLRHDDNWPPRCDISAGRGR
jgi:hypothetical protein